MRAAPFHPREEARLEALAACQVVDTADEQDFDEVLGLAARLARVPLAVVAFLERDRNWFRARVGLAAHQSPRAVSFCAHTILVDVDDVLMVEDARLDPRFSDNPSVTGEPHVVFYAGIPLRVGPERLPVGTLCVMDREPRALTAVELGDLRVLARQIEVQLDARRRTFELKATLAQLLHSEERLHAVIDTIHDGVLVHGADGGVLWSNGGAERVLGVGTSLAGQPLPPMTTCREEGEPLPLEARPASVAMQTGRSVRGVVMGIDRGDERRWLHLNSEPLIRPGETKPWAVVTSFIDITESKERERELRSARAFAERALQVQGAFLRMMSHELRTPMNGIMGMTELLRAEGATTELQSQRLATISDSAHALLEIINDILDYSKLEAGGRTLAVESVSLAEVVDDVLALAAPVAKARRLGLERAEGLGAYRVQADVNAVRQVLLNLVANALKFTEAGTVTVRARAEGAFIRVEVVDTGVGIAPTHRPRLFSPFSHAEPDTTRRSSGTGLGLAISQRLVEAMGGSIDVSTREGEGSTFWFTLPAAAALAPSVSARPMLEGARRRLRVLVVEDNIVNQRVTEGLLRVLGHEVVLAADGRAGLTAALTSDFDAVLMDIHMPVMDGLDATRGIRAEVGPRGRVPVVAVTASALADERAAYLAIGMNEVLAKPVSLEQLRRTLCAVVTAAPMPIDRGSSGRPGTEGASPASGVASSAA